MSNKITMSKLTAVVFVVSALVLAHYSSRTAYAEDKSVKSQQTLRPFSQHEVSKKVLNDWEFLNLSFSIKSAFASHMGESR